MEHLEAYNEYSAGNMSPASFIQALEHTNTSDVILILLAEKANNLEEFRRLLEEPTDHEYCAVVNAAMNMVDDISEIRWCGLQN